MDWEKYLDINKTIKERKIIFKNSFFFDTLNHVYFFIGLGIVIFALISGIIGLIKDEVELLQILKFIIVLAILFVWIMIYIKGLTQINKLKSISLHHGNRIDRPQLKNIIDELEWSILLEKELFIYARCYRGVFAGGQEILIIPRDNEILFNSTIVPITKDNFGYYRYPISFWTNKRNFKDFEEKLRTINK